MPTALVTGTRSELGAAYARELAERGYSIVLVADDAAFLADAAERLGRATGAIVETLVADAARPNAVLRRIADTGLPVGLLVAAERGRDASWSPRLVDAAVAAMTRRGRGAVLVVSDAPDATGGRPLPGLTVTAVRAGRPGTAVDVVVRRSLDDAARGRTVSAPGLVHRAIGCHLDVSRSLARRVGEVVRSARPGSRSVPEPGPTPAGHTRPSPVPTPFRGPRAAPLPVPGAGSPVLAELPVRPAHVAGPFPEPRTAGTGPLPAAAPRSAPPWSRPSTGAGGRPERRDVPLPEAADGAPPRPLQQPVHDPVTVRTVTG